MKTKDELKLKLYLIVCECDKGTTLSQLADISKLPECVLETYYRIGKEYLERNGMLDN